MKKTIKEDRTLCREPSASLKEAKTKSLYLLLEKTTMSSAYTNQ